MSERHDGMLDGDLITIEANKEQKFGEVKNCSILIVNKDTTNNVLIGSQKTGKGFPLEPEEKIILRHYKKDTLYVFNPNATAIQIKYLINPPK